MPTNNEKEIKSFRRKIPVAGIVPQRRCPHRSKGFSMPLYGNSRRRATAPLEAAPVRARTHKRMHSTLNIDRIGAGTHVDNDWKNPARCALPQNLNACNNKCQRRKQGPGRKQRSGTQDVCGRKKTLALMKYPQGSYTGTLLVFISRPYVEIFPHGDRASRP